MGKALEYEPLSLAEAKSLTERIRLAATEFLDLLIEAFNRRADVVLGFETWEGYVVSNFPSIPRFDPANRPALAKMLVKEVGMSTRQAAASLNVSPMTISRDSNTDEVVPNVTPPAPYVDPREAHAIELARSGLSLRQITKTLGVNERHPLVRDNEKVREARRLAQPDSMPSQTHEENTIACSIRPAKDVIIDIDMSLGNLLGNNYTLSKRDVSKLVAMLKARLMQLEEYGASN